MADLEAANRKVEAARATAVADAPSPSQSTESYSLISSGLASPDVGQPSDSGAQTRSDADVLDWIAKARESIEAFGGYISMGGPGATREMLAAEDDGSDHGLPLDGTDDAGFEIDVVDEEDDLEGGAGVSGDEGSVSTNRRAGSEAPTRKERLATIPNVAAPLGLLADLSLGTKGVRRKTSSSSMGGDDDGNENLGLANMDYFRASECSRFRRAPCFVSELW